MSNMEEHVLIQIFLSFNLCTTFYSLSKVKCNIIFFCMYIVYSNYLLVFSLAWRPPAGKVLYSWLSACEFNFFLFNVATIFDPFSALFCYLFQIDCKNM